MADPNRTEHRPGSADIHDLHKEVPSGPPGDPDRDVNTRMLWRVGIGLAIGCVVAGALMVVVFLVERARLDKADPAPSPMAEARIQQAPPGPLLQKEPNADLAAMRADEDRQLTTYGWTDRAAGLARVPIARAMEIVARQGVAPLGPAPRAEETAGAGPPQETPQ